MAANDEPANLDFDETSQPMEVDEPRIVLNTENECHCQSERCRDFNLSQQLDNILDPGLIFSSPNQPERLWNILAQGHQDAAAYIQALSEYRIVSHCAQAWPTGHVAYRCRTCSALPTMSLCTECFRAGDHSGHDYNMFKSRSGGACDCGFSFMKASGHCLNHGLNAKAPKSHEPIPESLTCIASRAMPRILSRLVIQLRRHAVGQTMETDIYLDCLMQIANSNVILKNLMVQVILSADSYSSQAELLSNHPDSRVSKIVRESQKILKRERKKLVPFKIPANWPITSRPISAFCLKGPHKTFLEELVFWMIVHEFHQKLVCFLLGFLMDNQYKDMFSKLFVDYYPNIAMCLANSNTDPRRNQQDSLEHLSRRISQVSVQIYNESALTKTICDERMTLHTLIYCIRIMIEGSQPDGIFSALKSNPLCKHDSNAPKVVCCDNIILRDRQLSSFTDDLITILDFEHEAKRLLSDKKLLQTWMELVSYFQTMSPYKRELNEHAPYETGPRQSVFMKETEFCLVPLWTILDHMMSLDSFLYTSQLLESVHASLASWLYKMSIGPHSKLDTYFMSFHIPLHRMLAATLRHMIYVQRVPENQVYNLLCDNQSIFGSKFSYRSAHGTRVAIKMDDFIKMLLLHPLQALTLYHQTRCGMWTRNGILTVNQAVTYVHCLYCYSIIDMDMFLLRYFASRLKADTFLRLFLQKFYAWHCLSFTCGPIFSDATMDALKVHYYFNIQPEQITQMVESCLVTLIQLLTLGNHCNISNREQTKQEMICLISVANRSYSYLTEMVPNVSEHHKDEELFPSLLDELTVYKPASHGSGGNLQQGHYTLKPDVWENDYNPIHVLYRYYQRRDYQLSLDRFFQHAKSTGKLNRRSHSSALWPPLRIPDKIADFGPIDLSSLVRCQTLLGVVFSIFYKSIYVEDIPDSMMAYTVHLLELALRRQMELSNDLDDKMDHDQNVDQKDRAKNPSFVGRYSYRELISYYENVPKEEAMLKGRTIYSLFTDDPIGPDPNSNVKLFPFVKHALDLSFDTTWFPFDSVIDNCLVHIETVHSLPRDEFDAMIQCTNSEKGCTESTYGDCPYAASSSERASEQTFPDVSTSSSTRSTESQTGAWSNLIGLEVEEVDDIEIEVDADDAEGNDVLEIDDLDDDEVTVEVEDPDELELSLLNQLSASEASPSTISPRRHGGSVSEASTFTSLTTAATISSTMEVVNSILPNLNDSQLALTTPERESTRRDINIEGYIRLRDYMDRLGNQNLADQQNATSYTPAASATIHHGGVVQEGESTSSPINVGAENNRDRQGQTSLPNEWATSPQQPQQLQPAQAQNLITERRAILDSQPRHMITNSLQPLALEGASASSMSGVAGTLSASTSTSNQDAQQGHRSQELAVELSAFNQNLTRAIGECTPNLTELRQQRGTSNQTERSLTEIDIQARFMGFFSTDTTSPSSSRINTSRIIRPRPTARRGNYRGAYLVEPYLTYNNLNNNNNNNATTANNNNNNNNESVQELVRRSVAVVPAITEAVRSTLNQRNGRIATRTQAAVAAGAERNQDPVGRDTRDPNESSRSSSNSPPPNPPAASERITPAIWMHNRVALLSPTSPYQWANRFITTGSTQQQIQPDQRSRRLRKEHRQHHGESIMTLLLRLHAKYSHQPRSYHYDDSRARTNLDPRKRCRIGDGVHFVTIALDLICVSDVQIRQRVEYLTELIWPKPANEKVTEKEVTVDGSESNERALRGETSAADSDDKEFVLKTSRAGKSSCAPTAAGDLRTPGASSTPASVFGLNLSNTVKSDSNPINPLASLTPEEKRHRAKERQIRLMAEFANKQRAFMEKYAANSSDLTAAGTGSRPLSDSNAGPTSAVMAHSASAVGSAAAGSSGCSSQKYSEPTLRASDKTQEAADSDPHGRYEEQPINLSSKANQEQASRSQSVSDVDNNRQETHCGTACESLGQCDSGSNDQAQSTSTLAAAGPSSVATSDKDISTTTATCPTAPKSGERHQPQQLGTNDSKDTQTSSVSASASNETANDEPYYECCICGIGGLSDSANPLGQVVLLQSTSVYGHSHLRPGSERKLPCDETEHLSLKEETYAKYLERRIDVLCDHFTKSSWLDSINIGAEGGVHVQSCGHHLHIECHQSYIRSLDLEDVMRMRNESDEFQCPVCRQLANSVLPILNDDFFPRSNPTGTGQAFPSTSKFSPAKKATKITSEPWDDPRCQQIRSGTKINYCDPAATDADCPTQPMAQTFFSRALTFSESLDDQIAQVSLQLRNRRAPNQRELQSSATFCSHLTKATGPQYRLIRTNASMHSLFLFLSSIARTNLETGLIARSIRSQNVHEKVGPSGDSGDCRDSLNAFGAETELDRRQQQRFSVRNTWQPSMDTSKGKHTCYQLLFHVLALNARTLISNQWCTYEHIWSRLTHQIADADRLSITPHNSEVPLLLRDTVAMLLQFLFTVSGSKSHTRTHFTCLVKVLFNLTVIQSTALVLSYVRSVPQFRDDELSNRSAASPQLAQHINIPSQPDGFQFPTLDQQLGGSSVTDHTDTESNQRLLALESLLSSVWSNLGSLLTRNNEEPLMNSVVRNSWPCLAGRREQELWCDNEQAQQRQQEQPVINQTDDDQVNRVDKLEFIENRVKLACLPFLRAAAFLQEHLYGGPSPNLMCELNEDCLREQLPVDEDFSQLVRCLELASTNLVSVLQQTVAPTKTTLTLEGETLSASSHITLHQSLNWPSSAGSGGSSLVVSWAAELLQFAKQYSIAARTLLLSRPLAWYRPALMQLPRSFDDIFMFYYRRKCSLCQQVPKDVAVCLVCGAPICFRASCCKDRSRSRQVHSQHCGANTAVFLAVHTSAVVVIRGNRACVWGSVYLDAHDEEDNGLQRGKPLYMVPARFALLEAQWLSHSFDHTCGKRWIYLQDAQ